MPLDAVGTAASMPISFVSMFSSLWLTITSEPTTNAAVLRPRLLTSHCQTDWPVATVIACMAPSLPPVKKVRTPSMLAMKGFA